MHALQTVEDRFDEGGATSSRKTEVNRSRESSATG